MHFRIERKGVNLSVTYLDYGKWYPVPEKYQIENEVKSLLQHVKHKKRRQYELEVSSSGIVSIDRDRELVLVPKE